MTIDKAKNDFSRISAPNSAVDSRSIIVPIQAVRLSVRAWEIKCRAHTSSKMLLLFFSFSYIQYIQSEKRRVTSLRKTGLCFEPLPSRENRKNFGVHFSSSLPLSLSKSISQTLFSLSLSFFIFFFALDVKTFRIRPYFFYLTIFSSPLFRRVTRPPLTIPLRIPCSQ